MVKNIIKRILIGVVIIFVLNFFRTGSLLGCIDTYALNRIELSSYNGTVLWSQNSLETVPANVNNVQFIIYYFDLQLTTQTKYQLDATFQYSVVDSLNVGVALQDLVLNNNVVTANATNFYPHFQTKLDNQYHNKYTNYILFTSNYQGNIQTKLVYKLAKPTFIGNVGYNNSNLIFQGSESSNTNQAINDSASNIISNNNKNTEKITGEQKKTQEEIKKQTEEQKKTNDTLNDPSVDDPNSDLSEMNSKIASNNAISQLLTLPIQLYQNILNSVNGSCSSFSLGSLYNHSITLPCINLKNLLGSTLFNIIDVLICGLFILSFRKKMVDIFNHITSLKDRGNELE